MKKCRLIVAGYRNFSRYGVGKRYIEAFLSKHEIPLGDLEIVSGTCTGADRIGEIFARVNGVPVRKFPPDWEFCGLSAGPYRNEEMVDYATHCLVFLHPKSRGSLNMIRVAQQRDLITEVVEINDETA